MKKTLFAISAIAVLLGFTACTSENEILEPQVSGKTITIKAYTEETTRTSLSGTDAAGYNVVWETGDEIKIGENTFTLTNGAGTTSGTFESTTATLTDGTEYTAYYPTTYDGTNWPTAQTYVENNIPDGSPMKATFTYTDGEEPSLSFKNEGGILRLNLTGTAKVTSIKISATGLDPITLDCGSTGVGLSTTTATPFHIAVPGADGEGTAYSGLKIVMTDDAGKVCTKTAKSAITVQRSKITDITLSASEFKADIPEGALPGLFSVSTTKKVRFSKGNLWADSDKALHFEANQYSFASTKDATHVSHFTWSSTVGAAVGNSNSGDNLFCDENHKVSVDGSDAIYYALSKDEWEYLFYNHSYKWVTVNGVNGYVIAPDGFTGTLAASYNDDAALATDNLVFLPAAGYCDVGSVSGPGSNGFYWSSTPIVSDIAYYLYLYSGGQYVSEGSYSYSYGGSVRAVLNK